MSASSLSAASSYSALSGCEKQKVLYEDGVLATPYATRPSITGSWSTLLGNIHSLLFVHQTFDTDSDFMPEGRQKVIHSHGSVAGIDWINDASSPYNGMFAPGTVCGVARLSLAGSPETLGFTPGLAVKLLVDGKPSVNFQVMHQLNGQGTNRNIFAHTFTNQLPEPEGFALGAVRFALSVAGFDLTHLDVDQASVIRKDGTLEANPVAPDEIALVPLQPNAIAVDSPNDFRVDLAQFPAGTGIYEVHGRNGGGAWVKFATVKLRTRFAASSFGDQQLFFRHYQK